jgi:hypothetical protein
MRWCGLHTAAGREPGLTFSLCGRIHSGNSTCKRRTALPEIKINETSPTSKINQSKPAQASYLSSTATGSELIASSDAITDNALLIKLAVSIELVRWNLR